MLGKFFAPLGMKIFAGVSLALLIGVTVQTVRVEHWKKVAQVLRIDLVKVKAEKEAEIAKHQATKRAYREAQEEAARLEAERLARVTNQQEAISNDRVQIYQRRLADARRIAEQLRRQGGASSGRATGSDAMSALPDTAGGADGASPVLSADERLIAQKQAIQLDELQNWVTDQTRVDTR